MTWPRLLTLALALAFTAFPAGAQDGRSPAHRYFTDVELVDQDGQRLRLYSDLLQGKVVVIDAIFTTCVGSCPVLTKTMARIQERLGDRLGREVRLLSLSVDPETDTPARLKAYAESFGARPGWHFLTGDRERVELALRKLGYYVERKEDHSPVIVVGNEPTGLWKKAFGLAGADQIYPIVESVLADRGGE